MASTPTSTVTNPHLSMIRRVYPRTPNGCESVWLLVLGLMEITLAIRARSAGRRIEHRELHPV